MLDKILHFSIHQRWMVLLVTLGMAVLGVYNYQRLPIDAVPDITNVQIQINTEAPGYSPLEAEQRITFPIETVLAGLPHLEQTRSLSRYGLSQVTVIFEDGTDIYLARQLVNERIQEAKEKLPPDVVPSMGPIATGLGEIYSYTVEAKPGALKEDQAPYTPTDLRTIQDWIIKPQLRNVPGLTEVNTMGGFAKQIHVTPDPNRLIAYGLAFQDVMAALAQNNSNIGAGYIEHSGEQYLIRAPGQVVDLDDIREIVLSTQDGVPVHIHDVAEVILGEELRTGAATENGEEVVLGTVIMLMGENSRTIAQNVSDKMEEINRTLPAGVIAKTVYNRTKLVDLTIETVKKNLLEGALLVVLVLFLLLGNIRAALITALVIPLSMLFTISVMVNNQISANLMSLGALDFGIIVDGAVVIVENSIRRLAEEQHRLQRRLTALERFHMVFEASVETRKAILFGQIIIMIVYLPILSLIGIEGKMFRPMALTVIAALLGAMILSVTFIPAAIAVFLSGRVSERENLLIRATKSLYIPSLNFALHNKTFILASAFVLLILCGLVTTKMGSEFIPTLDEGDFAAFVVRVPGTSLSQSIKMQKAVERRIQQFPEVQTAFSKIGTPEIATDPMPPSVADGFIILKPRAEWPDPHRSKADLGEEIEAELSKIPGNNYEFLQPIQMRFNELIAGVRGDVAIKVFGDDLNVMVETGEEIAQVLQEIPGATDVKVEQVTGLPLLTIRLNRKEMARYGLNISEVQDIIEIAIGGKNAGEVFEGDRRFEIVVRLPEEMRQDIERLKQIPVPLPRGEEEPTRALVSLATVLDREEIQAGFVPLGAVAEFDLSPGPNQISRENGKRRVVVSANVRGRDIGSFVEEAERIIQSRVAIPAGYWITWGGQFEQMISAAQRLQIVVPVALLLIFLLLFTTFGNLKDSILVFTGVPLALTGGILALLIRGIPLSISAGVGFIALSGVAVLNGLVMISYINNLRLEGIPLEEALRQGAIVRLRPVLMTALVASLGFVPMALATGTGAEVQRPLASVVIGGILSSTALTLIVLPVLYLLFHKTKQDSSSLEAAS